MTNTALPIAQLNPQDLVFVSQTDQLVTDTFLVAKYFSKLHKNVLQKIQNLDCPSEFTRLNFQLCHKNNELQNGKLQPFYQMTKDGFMYLVMNFTGKKAATIKVAYINAFNLMADKLNKKAAELPAPSQPLSYSTRVALTIENGNVVHSSQIPDDAFIVTKNRLCALLNEPGLFSIEEMAQLAQCSSRRLAELAQAFARLN
ncbi:hypothetical protein CSW98_01525 [Vibrio sp. HA2012]|uniref:Rha family transcriptional regulator n=1 Tax=Vibrio sp. HA2012 TaxID=1971595 RepID=UPI000C2C7269|nr:Rha family transcriptional regulator [Vibrio sp. HA2012]PJC87832.1 hypothetical protein CSW98_01525 [Vibrio sp. HA2012]